jgi:heme-degrading monooxygenase HmoA
MLVQIVRFRSGLDDERVLATYQARAPRYREVTGLLQKYYLAFPTGEHGAVYVWDSPQSMQAFRESDLARTIPEAYQVKGTPSVEVADVSLVLHSLSTPLAQA